MQIHSVAGALTVTFGVSVILFVFLEVGYRLGHHADRHAARAHEGTSVVEGAVLGLLGLMLTFTLAQSKDSFTTRKQLLVDTVNAVTTAYDRTALLPPDRQETVRRLMYEYVDAIVAAEKHGTDRGQRNDPHRKHAVAVQHEMWTQSVEGCTGNESCQQVLLPALNDVSQFAFQHLALTQSHKPWAILGFLLVLAAFGAVLAGFALVVYGKRQWVHWTLYVVSIATSLYMIIEVEFPTRWGLIHITAGSAGLEEVLTRFTQ